MGRVVRTGLWVDIAASEMTVGWVSIVSRPPEQTKKSIHVAAVQLFVTQVARSVLRMLALAFLQ